VEPIRLVIISPHRDEIREEVAIGFKSWFAKRNPGEQPVEVVWQDIGGGSSAIARYIRSQFREKPDGIGIDVLFGGGTDIYLRFADEGLLMPLDMKHLIQDRIRPSLNGVPLYDEKGRWFGPMLSSFGILCNREVLRRIGHPGLPENWEDLGSPQLRGWVGAGDPRLTGSVHMVYEIILQGEGWDAGFRQLLLLGSNVHTFIRDSGTLTRVVITGEVAAAGNVDVNALSAVGQNPDMMTFVLPAVKRRTTPEGNVVLSGGTIVNPDAIAVLKGAPHKELARAFVEFTLSDAGQRLFLLQPGIPGGPQWHPLCRLSIVESLYKQYSPDQRSVGAANPFTQTRGLPYKSKIGEQRWDALNDILGAVIVDAHDELAATRASLVGLPEDVYSRLLADLTTPPCSEDELAAHARRIVEQGPRARAAQINQWGEAARERYRRIRQEAESLRKN
jgi:iron(III) transport system substrate-binding protein